MSAKSTRIGFVDYNLKNFHSNVYLKHVRGALKDRGFVVAGCWAMQEKESRPWAEENHVPYLSNVEELNRAVDGFIVLAPANPEVHYELCRRVFPFGKPTFVDKTFAPDIETAKSIFDLADTHRVVMETSSALRYTDVQAYAGKVGRKNIRHMAAWGGGRTFGEYAIHPTEMVVSCMGPHAEALMRRGTGDQSQLLVNFSEERTAVINVYFKTPFSATVTTPTETRYFTVDNQRLFIDAAAAMLNLFDENTSKIDRAESLMIRKILDAAEAPNALRGFIPL